tara:strand:- start:207 stop:437 length:231 start_codon:yes stop_codon:yes gene_type:complete
MKWINALDLIRELYDEDENSPQVIQNHYIKEKDKLFHQMNISVCNISCIGCAENQANQEGHMGPGGCLEEDDELDE